MYVFLPKKFQHLLDLSKSELQDPERPPEITSFYKDFSNCHLYLSASLPGNGNHQLECTNIHSGRFVTISKSSSTSTLALCEVQVFGSKYPLFDTYLKTHWFVFLLINFRNNIYVHHNALQEGTLCCFQGLENIWIKFCNGCVWKITFRSINKEYF